MIRPIGKHILCEQIIPGKSPGGIIYTDLSRDRFHLSDSRWFWVRAVGAKVKDVAPGDRIVCLSYTSGPAWLMNGLCIVDIDQVLMVLPKIKASQDFSTASEQ